MTESGTGLGNPENIIPPDKGDVPAGRPQTIIRLVMSRETAEALERGALDGGFPTIRDYISSNISDRKIPPVA